jgi:glycosyltransferase involved in cell wall biosynthesis
MASERLVVASDVPSVREWLGPTAPWALVPVGDAQATATAIRRALELSQETRQDLVRQFRETVIAKAEYEQNMQIVEADYRALVKARRV